MRKKTLLLSLLPVIIFSTCKNDCDEPEPLVPEKAIAAWVVGDFDSTQYGTILHSIDGGAYWSRQAVEHPALRYTGLLDVWVIDKDHAWVVGEKNTIMKTGDAGDTWVKVPGPSSRNDAELSSISIIGSDNIWISGGPALVYNSTDGGNTWTVFDTANFHKAYLQGIHAINESVVYAAGGILTPTWKEEGFIVRTIDGGQTWEEIVLPDGYNRNEWIGVKAADADHVVVYGGHAHYSYTYDGGKTWHNDSVPNTGGTGGADINCLTMLDIETWWGAFDYDGIHITKNAGVNWETQPTAGPAGMWLLGIDYYNMDHALIVGGETTGQFGKIIRTTDGGFTWQLADVRDAYLVKVAMVKE